MFEDREIIARLAQIRRDLYAGKIDRSTIVTLPLPASAASLLKARLEWGERDQRELTRVWLTLREIAARSRETAAQLRKAGLIPSAKDDLKRQREQIAFAYLEMTTDGRSFTGWSWRDAWLIAMPLLQKFPEHPREVAIYALAKYLRRSPEDLQKELSDSRRIRGRMKQAREEFIREHLDLWRQLHGEREEDADRKSAESLPGCPPAVLSVPHELPFGEFLVEVRKTMPLWEGGTDGLREAAVRSFATYLEIAPELVRANLRDHDQIITDELRHHPQRDWISEHLQIWRRIHGEMPEALGGNEPPFGVYGV